ncbi:hypothetical protein C8F04DRAFT_1031308 [Mycena alexandri]|uniref:SET domain-containing protein n=1 Tax=Mycena alexandri TaxID=1745969 RepID=A0AAD6X764_9AGAR|nr:hypothetical protein C8F04DRAFT_1031308 [Mycena alexandri]
MSFTKLKAARQAKHSYSYVTPTSQHSESSASANSSSALPSEALTPEPEPQLVEPAKIIVHEDGGAKLYTSLPSYLEIRTSPTSGRGLWTTRGCSAVILIYFCAGQVLLAAKPHAAALSNDRLGQHCSQCFGVGAKRCTKCQIVFYCDSACQTLDWPLHKHECAALERIAASGETALPSDAIRCLGRILWGRRRAGVASVWTREIDGLQSHTTTATSQSQSQLHTHLALALVRYLGLSSPAEIAAFGIESGRELAALVSKFTTNTFTLTDPALAPLGAGVAPSIALINHACEPNAVVVVPRASSAFASTFVKGEGDKNADARAKMEPLMQVVALRDIGAGEEILTAYIDTTLPREQRRAALRETYHFECECALCGPSSSGTATSPGTKITDGGEVDPRSSVWCPKQCGGTCPAPTDDIPLSRCVKCRAPLHKTDEVLDAVRVGCEALEKAGTLQFTDPDYALRLTTNLLPILSSAGLTPGAHPLLGLARLHSALLIAGLASQPGSSQSATPAGPSTPAPPPPTAADAQASLDAAIRAAAQVVAGLDMVLRYGHPVRGIARAELGRLLAVDEPAPNVPAAGAGAPASVLSSSSAAVSSSSPLASSSSILTPSNPAVLRTEPPRFPPSGAPRLRLALDTLVRARAELLIGFGVANEGGAVGREVREDIVRIERELGVWRKALGEGIKDAKDLEKGKMGRS